MKVNQKMLQDRIDYLNEITNNPLKTWERKDGHSICNIGNYCLDSAYGGHRLVKIINSGGGQTDITSGYISKKDLYYQINAFIDGVLSQQN